MELLAPFKKVTTLISSESQCTVSLIYPMKQMLIKQLNDFTPDSRQIAAARDAIRADLEPRYVFNICLSLNFKFEFNFKT